MMEWAKYLIEKGQAILKSINFANVTPSKENVLNFLNMKPSTIKVVIVGQDPYPTPGVANGKAFAVNKGKALPKSLQNIFKEIKEVQGQVYTDETLDHWTQQGVLLLNASLTTEVNKPNAHKHLWQDYTKEVIAWLDQNFNVIWVLWGSEAQRLGYNLQGQKICDAHPSPLSAHRRNKQTFKQLNFIKW